MGKRLNKKGQSTLEYVIVLTAIVAAIIYGALNFIKPATNKVYADMNTSISGAGSSFGNYVGSGRISSGAGATQPAN